MISNMKISQKITVAFGVLIVISLIVNMVVFFKLNTISEASQANSRTYYMSIDAQRILRGLIEQQSAASRYVISGGEDLAKSYAETGAKVDQALSHFIENTGNAEQKARATRLQTELAAWRKDWAERPMALSRDPATRSQAFDLMGRRSLSELRAVLDEIVKTQDEIQAEHMKQQADAIELAMLVFAIGSAVALLAAVGMSLALARLIARPVVGMTSAMRRLAGGDNAVEVPARGRKDEIGEMAGAVQVFKEAAIEKLRVEAEVEAERARNEAARAEAAREQALVVESIATGLDRLSAGDLVYRITQAFAPDYEKLRNDFNGAMGQLQETMKVINAATLGIRSGTEEISQAADDLSKRTEQQAASLEETAAALDQITATVRKTAEGANHARNVVSTAKQDAERSGEVVREAVAAMSEIEKSAQQISQIIGVIDEIAFQTNLLALNAGVEAARAGDAGKGFAVVASEVRALAQRSADAAKEIKTLISASTQQVGSGVTLVGETGEALARIVAQVADINGVVSEIAASAQEQATGLNQVNTAVNQMDQVTQQNAAMVEESTAASHSLAQETEELAGLISRFQVGDAQVRSVRTSARAAETAQAPRPALKTVSTHAGGGGAALRPQPTPEVDNWEEF